MVGTASGLSLFLNEMTDEWFDWSHKLSATLVFWTAIYGYCLVALWQLGSIHTLRVYGGFAVCVTVFTLLLSCKSNKEPLPVR